MDFYLPPTPSANVYKFLMFKFGESKNLIFLICVSGFPKEPDAIEVLITFLRRKKFFFVWTEHIIHLTQIWMAEIVMCREIYN